MSNITLSLKRFWDTAVSPIKNTLTSHTGNTTNHITAAERTAWNAKADASDCAVVTEQMIQTMVNGTYG